MGSGVFVTVSKCPDPGVTKKDYRHYKNPFIGCNGVTMPINTGGYTLI